MTVKKKGRRRLLLVDDDRVNAEFMTHILKAAAFEIQVAASVEESLVIIAQWEPDLALLDISMQGTSGFDLAKSLRAKGSVPFMFVSSHQEIAIIRAAAEYGAVGYLVKPVDSAQIVPTVEAALSRGDEIKDLKRTELNLTSALAAGRETSVAVGVLMVTHQSDRNAAFEMLRDYARSRRLKINDVAKDLLAAQETINNFKV
jgi:AmiR/NasT family two-component response regulator